MERCRSRRRRCKYKGRGSNQITLAAVVTIGMALLILLVAFAAAVVAITAIERSGIARRGRGMGVLMKGSHMKRRGSRCSGDRYFYWSMDLRGLFLLLLRRGGIREGRLL